MKNTNLSERVISYIGISGLVIFLLALFLNLGNPLLGVGFILFLAAGFLAPIFSKTI